MRNPAKLLPFHETIWNTWICWVNPRSQWSSWRLVLAPNHKIEWIVYPLTPWMFNIAPKKENILKGKDHLPFPSFFRGKLALKLQGLLVPRVVGCFTPMDIYGSTIRRNRFHPKVLCRFPFPKAPWKAIHQSSHPTSVARPNEEFPQSHPSTESSGNESKISGWKWMAISIKPNNKDSENKMAMFFL